jgi:hypothetical protein
MAAMLLLAACSHHLHNHPIGPQLAADLSSILVVVATSWRGRATDAAVEPTQQGSRRSRAVPIARRCSALLGFSTIAAESPQAGPEGCEETSGQLQLQKQKGRNWVRQAA